MAKPLFTMLVTVVTPKRRWAQFSLATMFVVVTILCVWLAAVVNRAHRQRDAVAAIKALGGRVDYVKPDQKATEAFPRRILRRWLPQDYVDDVQDVILTGTQDTGLAHVQGLTGLRGLSLAGTLVTDEGLAHLQGMTWLQGLNLEFTQVTDAGLAHLQGLTGLKSLSLDRTQVTDVGLVHLRGLTRLQWLGLGRTQVTDAGLAQLYGLTRLNWISLGDTQVTDAGRADLQAALPTCHVHWW